MNVAYAVEHLSKLILVFVLLFFHSSKLFVDTNLRKLNNYHNLRKVIRFILSFSGKKCFVNTTRASYAFSMKSGDKVDNA